MERVSAVPTNQVSVHRLSMSSHHGTHLDAPAHFFDPAGGVDDIPLERVCGPATWIDLAPGSALERGSWITLDMLKPHAKKFVPGARVIYRTGWGSDFGKPSYYEGFPSLTLEAAQWIADQGIGLIGMDTPSPSSLWLEVHHALLGAQTPLVIVEGLRDPARLPDQFVLLTLPLNLAGCDGSPIRAVALVEDAASSELSR